MAIQVYKPTFTDHDIAETYTRGYNRGLEAAINLLDHILAELAEKGNVPVHDALRILRESYVSMMDLSEG